MTLTVAISGGGIGGLATAAAFAQRGWRVTVYERQPELRTVGAGIYIWENGLRVLEAIGAYAEATEGAFRGTHFQQRDNKNRIMDAGALPADMRLVSPPRSQLLNALKNACVRSGVQIVTSTETVGATPRGELIFAGGIRVQADLAIGVDGIWSKVRESLGLESLHEQTREGCLRLIIRAEPAKFEKSDVGKYIENWNGLKRFLITPVNAQEIYLAMTCPEDDEEGKRIPINKDVWKESFPRWAHLIDRIGPIATWGVYSIIRCHAWSAGRTAILGDAAHAQPPNLGQGGGMAMQNGLALAVALEKVTDRRDIPAALEAWEASERPIIEHCQRWSKFYGEITYLPDDVRFRVVQSALSDPWVASQIFRAANHQPVGTKAPDARVLRNFANAYAESN